MIGPPVFAWASLLFTALIFEKTVGALHYGSRRWPRWVWAGLTVALCPRFLTEAVGADSGHLREVAFAAVAVFFSVKFLEDGELADALFLPVAAAAQFWLGLEIPVFEWAMLASCGLFLIEKTQRPLGRLAILAATAAVLFAFLLKHGLPKGDWNWPRIQPLLLPFWPVFGLFMPVCLFFLKKTDLAPRPKKWLAAATATSVLTAVGWPFARRVEVELAWLGMAVIAFPVFDRGLLYGLVYLKKWKIWALVGFFALVQLAAVGFMCCDDFAVRLAIFAAHFFL